MKETTRKLTESGILIALATILTFIKIFQLPFGGEITLLSMLPIVLNGYRNGLMWGIGSGFVYSFIQILTGMSTVRSFFLPESGFTIWIALLVLLLDYILAYTALGLGGLFCGKYKNSALGLGLATLVALFARYLCHFVSGFLFYGAWAEWFFGQENFYKIGGWILENFSGTSLSAVYSLFYNGLYMIPEIVITTIVAFIIGAFPMIVKKKQ